MSTLQLSQELMTGIQQVLERHDSKTADAGVGIQYLAAIMGVLVAQYPGDEERRRRVLQQLLEFTQNVFEDHLKDQRAPESDRDDSPFGPGFGVWRPE